MRAQLLDVGLRAIIASARSQERHNNPEEIKIRMSFSKQQTFFEQNVVENHNMEQLYLSCVKTRGTLSAATDEKAPFNSRRQMVGVCGTVLKKTSPPMSQSCPPTTYTQAEWKKKDVSSCSYW